ncbi:hypothetical protein ACFE04_027504 [Oxalis oulophora]
MSDSRDHNSFERRKGNGKRTSAPAVALAETSSSPPPTTAAPCGACKFLRRKCMSGCIFAPHFGSDQGSARFAAVHKVFGASNVSKLLLHIPMNRRHDAVVTISYEAQARLSDPVYGCVSTILALQQQVASLQAELTMVQTQLINNRFAMANALQSSQQQETNLHHHHLQPPLGVVLQPAYSNNNSAASSNLMNNNNNMGCSFVSSSNFDFVAETAPNLSMDPPGGLQQLISSCPINDDEDDEEESGQINIPDMFSNDILHHRR